MTFFIESLINTLVFSIGVAFFSGLIGLTLAWSTLQFPKIIQQPMVQLLSLPFAFPPFLLAIAWIGLSQSLGFQVYGMLGMIFIFTLTAFVYPFSESYQALSRINKSYEEAARMSGATPKERFLKITLPLIFPPLLNGVLLSYLSALAAFGVPALLGAHTRTSVLTTLLYSEMRMGGEQGMKNAIYLTFALLILASFGFILLNRSQKIQKERKMILVTSRLHSNQNYSKEKLLLIGLFIGVTFWIIISLILPWISLGLQSGHFKDVFENTDFHIALMNSFILCLSSAFVLSIGGFIWVYFFPTKGQLLSKFIFSLPGSIVAILLILFGALYTRFTGLFVPPLILIFLSYVLKFSSISLGRFHQSFSQFDVALDEAAQMQGAYSYERLFKIWLPLMTSVISSIFILVFLQSLNELNMSILLTGPGASTIGTLLFDYHSYAEPEMATTIAFLLTTVAILLGLSLQLKGKKT